MGGLGDRCVCEVSPKFWNIFGIFSHNPPFHPTPKPPRPRRTFQPVIGRKKTWFHPLTEPCPSLIIHPMTTDTYIPGVCLGCSRAAPVLVADGSGMDEGVGCCKPCVDELMAYMADPLGDHNAWWPYGEPDESRHWE